MSLVRFNPVGLTPWFDDFDRFFDRAFAPVLREPSNARSWAPRVDIAEDEKKIVLRADLPGVEEKDVDIRIEDGTLTLKGERKFEKETKEENYHRVERSFGSFQRSFGLPENVDVDKVAASYKNGVLEVTLPKIEEQPKKVKVVNLQ